MYPELQQEWLARDLQSLVGYGAQLHHVEKRTRALNWTQEQYPEVERKDDLAVLFVARLEQVVPVLPVPDAEAAQVLLKLNGRCLTWDAVRRRAEAIELLKREDSIETWRKIPELNFMRSVAKVLVTR